MATTNPRILWPITLTASNRTLRVRYPAGGGGTTFDVTVGTIGNTYYVSGDGAADDLLLAIKTALIAQVGFTTDWDATVDAAGLVTLFYDDSLSNYCDLLFSAPQSTLHPAIGFASSDRMSLPFNWSEPGTLQHQFGWYPERPLVSTSGDSEERDIASSVTVSGRSAVSVYASRTHRYERIDRIPLGKIIDGEAGYTNEALQLFWEDPVAVTDFRFYPDAATPSPYVDPPTLATTPRRCSIADGAWLSRLVDKSAFIGPSGGAAVQEWANRPDMFRVVLPLLPYVA